MTLEDRLLNNFRHLRPELRQELLDISERLLSQQVQAVPAAELSHQEHLRRLALLNEIAALAEPHASSGNRSDPEFFGTG
ncbi:MAG: hypothetical protein ACAI44_02360 [Candidatus Sericytochromatia bacterium]